MGRRRAPSDPAVERVRATLEARFGLPGVQATTQLGPYVLLERLGAGATGVVLRAVDQVADRTVALKIVHPELDTPAMRDELRRRASASGLVRSEYIVPVIDVDTTGERPYLAMAYAPGRTLRRWLADARQSSPSIVRAYAQVAHGLADAHACGLVHGDVKAEHAIIDNDGHVALIDFGGHGCAQDDQLALCDALLVALVGDDEPATHGERAVDLPVALQRVIARGLATDPTARWPSLQALAEALAGDG